MSFLIQRSAGRGLTLAQVNTAVLRIGRGTNQELRSENPAVAMEHAVIESDAAGYLITDKGSITGTYVNRKPVESARLSKGDVIEIGDLRIEVQVADAGKPLFLRVVTARVTTTFVEEEEEVAEAVAAAPGARVVKAKKIDYVGAYRLKRPWLTKLSVTAILLIVALAIIGEVIRPERQAAFMPGGVSSAHARTRTPQGQRVATQCDACHTPWNSVSTRKCEKCHAQGPHSGSGAMTVAMKEPDCFTCHAEHRDQRSIAPIDDTTCVGCHARLEQRVTSFGAAHPELTYARDTNTLRFNHELHLSPRGIFNASGRREVLQCAGCHEMTTVRDKIDPVALKFDQHCQRCHLLTFDPRLPNAQIPHGGDAGTALGYLIGVYSGERDLAGKSSVEVRRILATRSRANADVGAVVRARQQFRFKCQKCHVVEQKGTELGVVRPHIPPRWLVRATFTHGPHLKDQCEHCHRGVRESVATTDALMPRRAECIDCHAANAKVQQAASTCRSCHEYHLQPRSQTKTASLVQAGMGGLGGGGRMLQGILLAVIVILLLVVLVPVGIALFQRLRPERSVSAPPKAAPSPRSAPPPRVDVPTDKVTKQNVPPPDIINAPTDVRPALRIDPAPAPPQQRFDETRLDAPQPAGAATPGGTEIVQWNGLLHCTSGPLEGQRFVIEDEGLYIGRDPALAKIVIPDTRVSKRHLRIVPRDGKVWAIDQNSTNGTFLKDQRITEVQLKRGDTLVLGDNAATFVYQI
jgi:pSer/pThr/pTyr-binding forkhead associated (FHA) protein